VDSPYTEYVVESYSKHGGVIWFG